MCCSHLSASFILLFATFCNCLSSPRCQQFCQCHQTPTRGSELFHICRGWCRRCHRWCPSKCGAWWHLQHSLSICLSICQRKKRRKMNLPTASAKADERRARPEPGMDNVPGSDRIFRSVTFLKTVPRHRLSEGLEWVRNVTHSLSSEGLLAVLYMLTRLKPSCRITDLRFWDWLRSLVFVVVCFLWFLLLLLLEGWYDTYAHFDSWTVAQRVCNSGVSTYTDLFHAFDRASKRMEQLSGAGTTDSIVNKLPLSPEDANVLQQAIATGWATCHRWNVFHVFCSCSCSCWQVLTIASVTIAHVRKQLTSADKCWEYVKLSSTIITCLAIEYNNHNMFVVVVVVLLLLDSLLSGSKVDGDQGQESPMAFWQRLWSDCCVWSSTSGQPCASSTIANGTCPKSCKCCKCPSSCNCKCSSNSNRCPSSCIACHDDCACHTK